MAVALSPSRRRWDDGIPPVLRPLVRAYLLGYASSVAPRLLTLLLQHVTRRKRDGQAAGRHAEPLLAAVRRILRGGLDWQRFPTFCAALVGGSTLLELPLRAVFDRLAKNLSDIARTRLSRWFASFIAAWLSLRLLQSKQTPGFTDTVAETNGAAAAPRPKTVRYAGRTLDLTFFAVTRALDVMGGELWHRRRLRRQAAGRWTAAEAAVARFADPAVFALSSGLIMWTWIYDPARLPRGYDRWIGSAAAVDGRLIEALQRCRRGDLRYGEDTGQAGLLGSMCADYGWPRHWGDPARSVPFPCEMVHMGRGPSCELHAAWRFARSLRWAMATYLPLGLLLAARRPSRAALQRALVSAARSSAFLAAFIALFYYGVCLARTRLGPRLAGLGADVGADAKAGADFFQRVDGGGCVAAGCLLCGWSVLLEHPARRKDLALFVAPRALAALFPRRYGPDRQWRETLRLRRQHRRRLHVRAREQARVRGVLGGLLESVLRP